MKNLAKFSLLFTCLFLFAIITSACGGGGGGDSYYPMSFVTNTGGGTGSNVPGGSGTFTTNGTTTIEGGQYVINNTNKVIYLSKNAFTLEKNQTDNVIAYIDGKDITNDVTFTVLQQTVGKGNVATVVKGLITAIQNGTVTIRVSYPDAMDAVFVVTVADPDLPYIEASKSQIYLDMEKSTPDDQKFVLTLNGADVTAIAQYDSSDKNVFTVDSNGYITPVGEGDANLIARVQGANDLVLPVKIHNPADHRIVINPESLVMYVGETGNIKVMVGKKDVTTNTAICHFSTSSSILTVNDNGLITANEVGTATLHIKVDNTEADKDVPVTIKAEEEFVLPVIEPVVLLPGNTQQLHIYVEGRDVAPYCTFHSENTDIATVDEGGNVHIVDIGDTYISYTYNNQTEQVQITGDRTVQNTTTSVTGQPVTVNSSIYTPKEAEQTIQYIKDAGLIADESVLDGVDEVVEIDNTTDVTSITITLNGKEGKKVAVVTKETGELTYLTTEEVGEDGTITFNVEEKTTELQIKKENVYLVVGDTETIVITVNATPVTGSVRYEVINPSVCSIDRYGKITALGSGTTRIKCHYDGTKEDKYINVRVDGDETKVTLNDNVLNQLYEIGKVAYNSSNKTQLTVLNIPAIYTYNGGNYKIIGIADNEFNSCLHLTRVNMPSSIKTVGANSFSNCTSLNDLTIGEGVESIGYGAFYNCTDLGTVTIPDSVKTIGSGTTNNGAFQNCTKLQTVTIGNQVTHIYGNTFRACSSLSDVTIGPKVTYIEHGAFAYCTSLRSIIIPDNVKTLAPRSRGWDSYYGRRTSVGVFEGCINLTDITLGEYLETIGYDVFKDCTALQTIVIPNRVIYISCNSFENCPKLANLTLGNSVKYIEGSAFYGCTDLTKVNIPNSVITIDSSAFYNCNNIATLNLGTGVKNINTSAFQNCTSLRKIVIPDSVTSIGNSAFRACSNIRNLTIGANVTSIGEYSFYGDTGLTAVTIPQNVTSIGQYAFSNCINLSNFTFEGNVSSIGTNAINTGCDIDVTFTDNVTYIGSSMFTGNTKLRSINLPSTLKTINDSAFSGCTGLTNVTIPNSCITIGSSAFNGCTSLVNITIPDSVVNINNSAFYNCNNLPSITIPDSVTSIGQSAFENCTELTEVNIGDGVTYIAPYAFRYCSKLVYLNLGQNISHIDCEAFRGCTSLATLEIPASVRTLGNLAWSNYYGRPDSTGPFYGCTQLTDLTIGQNIETIGHYTFAQCPHLTRVTIPSKVTTIGWYIFSGDTALKYVTIEGNITSSLTDNKTFDSGASELHITLTNTVTQIQTAAFRNLTVLKTISIPNTVTNIRTEAFNGCTGLTQIVIPDSVTSIAENTFYNCTNLTNVTIGNQVATIGYGAFYNCKNITQIDIPDSVINIAGPSSTSGIGAFQNCTGLQTVNLGDNVRFVGMNAFKECTALETINIPDTVTDIGQHAFYNCSSLTELTVPSTVEVIGTNAFYNVPHVTYNGEDTGSPWGAVAIN